MLISERIYRYLAERGLSQAEFSARTGIAQSTISDWKRKGTNPSADKIMIICEVLDISPYELLSGADSKKCRDYRESDCVVVDRQSKAYRMMQLYQNLDPDAQKYLEGYMKALYDLR